jgi:DNA-binding response OmpR family regulator
VNTGQQSHFGSGGFAVPDFERGRLPAVADMNVLVVEDSPEYVQAIRALLNGAYSVRTASSIAEAKEALGALSPDMVVLDLILPDGDGLDLLMHIRERSNAHVLVLSARDDEVDKVIGFKLGADDYVTKPFSPRELAARIEAMSRRALQREVGGDKKVGRLVVRREAREVEFDGAPVALTRLQFDLLDTFVSSPKTVFTRQRLLEHLWGSNWYSDDHVVDVHVANLRKKLAAAGAPNVVRTVRGVGYGLATDPS